MNEVSPKRVMVIAAIESVAQLLSSLDHDFRMTVNEPESFGYMVVLPDDTIMNILISRSPTVASEMRLHRRSEIQALLALKYVDGQITASVGAAALGRELPIPVPVMESFLDRVIDAALAVKGRSFTLPKTPDAAPQP